MAFPGGSLDVGCILKMFNSKQDLAPVVVQISEIKRIQPQAKPNETQSVQERYRLLISDSKHYIPAMLTTQLNHHVQNQTIQSLVVVRLTEYLCQPIQSKNGTSHIVVILNLQPVSYALPKIIGSPEDVATVVNASLQSSPSPQQSKPLHPSPTAAPSHSSVVTTSKPRPVTTSPGYPASTKTEYHNDAPDNHSFVPIKLLDPYLQKWEILARCSYKTDIKTWSNERSEGQLFSVTLLDESGEIRATCFQDAVDKFFPVFEMDQVYRISQGQLKFANKRYTSIKHPYELTLDSHSRVIPVDSSSLALPHLHFDFVEIGRIQDANKDDMVDIIGVVSSVKPVTSLQSKRGEISKRVIEIADMSNWSVELTLWGERAIGFDQIERQYGANPVIAIKGVRVSDFGGRTLNTVINSEFEINPDLPITASLNRWFENLSIANRQTIPSISRGPSGSMGPALGNVEHTLSSISNQNLGLNAMADYLYIPNVTFTSLKKEGTLWYKACANPDCRSRKVHEEAGGLRCSHCQSFNNYSLRWVISATAYDHTGKEFLSAFGPIGDTIMGYTADQVSELRERGDEIALQQIFEEARFKSYHIRISVKNEVYNDSHRLKCTILTANPMDYVADSKRLLSQIEALQNS